MNKYMEMNLCKHYNYNQEKKQNKNKIKTVMIFVVNENI